MKAGEHRSLQVLFENLNLEPIRDVLMGAYHGAGPGRSPYNPLGLFRFKLLMALKGYGSQRALERDVRVDEKLRGLCGFDAIPSHSTIVRFERRFGFKRLKTLINYAIDDLIRRGFMKGLRVVLDAKPFKARCRRDSRNPSRGWLDRDARVGRV